MARQRFRRPDRVRYQLAGATPGLIALAGICLVGWLITDLREQLVLGAAVLAAVLVDGVLADRAVRRASVDLHHPGEVVAGVAGTWTARVHRWSRPVTLTPLLAPGAVELRVLDDQPGLLVWCPLRRGTVHFAMVDLKATGPLGLVRSGRRITIHFPAPLYVTPPAIETEVRWPKPRAVSFGLAEGAPAGDDLFRSIRPYHVGDERRRVDWKATVRHRELMVRESEGTGVVLVRVVVDLGLPGPAAEIVAGMAVWVACEALARGWDVELVTLDAGRSIPQLAEPGRAYGAPPTVAPPPLLALPTISARVRTPADVRRRLATTAFGTPAVAAGGRRALTCSVTAQGVGWS